VPLPVALAAHATDSSATLNTLNATDQLRRLDFNAGSVSLVAYRGKVGRKRSTSLRGRISELRGSGDIYEHSPSRASLLMAVSDGDDEQSRLPRVGFDSRGGRQLVEGCCHTNRVC
jgi:hypothetical protein